MLRKSYKFAVGAVGNAHWVQGSLWCCPLLSYERDGFCVIQEPLSDRALMPCQTVAGVGPFPSWLLWTVAEYGRPRLFY